MKSETSRHDDQKLIKLVEEYLVDKRGYVVRMPNPGKEVILLLSGGMDSVVAWGWLMAKFKLKVYPLHVESESEPVQERSIRFFEKYYRKRFPDLFHEPFYFRGNYLPKEIADSLKIYKNSPESILETYSKTDRNWSAPYFKGVNMTSAYFGASYAEYLRLTEGVKVEAIYCGVTAGDGQGVWSQTMTYMRATMMNLGIFVNNPRIQFTSIFYEKDENRFYDKSGVVKLGTEMGLPLEKTFSCYRQGWWHCGDCGGCISRKEGFKKAKVADRTIYISEIRKKMTGKLLFFLNKTKGIIGSLKRKFMRRFDLLP